MDVEFNPVGLLYGLFIKGEARVLETAKKFKGSMFGYRKSDVNGYIMNAAREYEEKKKRQEAENRELAEKYAAVKAEKQTLSDKVASLEKERNYIADALLDAKQEAEKIVADARVEAAQIRSDLEIELEKLRAQIRSEQEQLKTIRAGAKETLEAYIGRLSDIDMKIDADRRDGGCQEPEEYGNIDEDDDIYIPSGEEDVESDDEDDDFAFEIEDIEA